MLSLCFFRPLNVLSTRWASVSHFCSNDACDDFFAVRLNLLLWFEHLYSYFQCFSVTRSARLFILDCIKGNAVRLISFMNKLRTSSTDLSVIQIWNWCCSVLFCWHRLTLSSLVSLFPIQSSWTGCCCYHCQTGRPEFDVICTMIDTEKGICMSLCKSVQCLGVT